MNFETCILGDEQQELKFNIKIMYDDPQQMNFSSRIIIHEL